MRHKDKLTLLGTMMAFCTLVTFFATGFFTNSWIGAAGVAALVAAACVFLFQPILKGWVTKDAKEQLEPDWKKEWSKVSTILLMLPSGPEKELLKECGSLLRNKLLELERTEQLQFSPLLLEVLPEYFVLVRLYEKLVTQPKSEALTKELGWIPGSLEGYLALTKDRCDEVSLPALSPDDSFTADTLRHQITDALEVRAAMAAQRKERQ